MIFINQGEKQTDTHGGSRLTYVYELYIPLLTQPDPTVNCEVIWASYGMTFDCLSACRDANRDRPTVLSGWELSACHPLQNG